MLEAKPEHLIGERAAPPTAMGSTTTSSRTA
jgi:hypothetical protein